MSNFKGTKGKWEIDLSYNSTERVQIINVNNNGFIDVWKLGEITKEEMQANAKLIAFAPEMLEMLERIIENYDKGTQTYLDCKELIKKATE